MADDGGGITLNIASSRSSGSPAAISSNRAHQRAPRHAKRVHRSAKSPKGKDTKMPLPSGPTMRIKQGADAVSKKPKGVRKQAPRSRSLDDDFDEGGPRGGGGGRSSGGGQARPWERVPDKKDVFQAQPLKEEVVPANKGLSKFKAPVGKTANRSDDGTFSIQTFGDKRLALLPELVENIEHKFGATQLTHVQRGAIPALMRGADVLMKARTGTGKTLAYLTPVVQWLASKPERVPRSAGTQAVVLVPTRELALQVHDVLVQLLRPFHWLVPGLLVGGEKKKSEKARIRKGLTIVVGTPGRLADHTSTTQCWDVSHVQFLILDEADRLMDMGFERDIARVCGHIKESRSKACHQRMQSVLVSATLDKRVRGLASSSLSTPTLVSDQADADGDGGAGVDDDDTKRKFEIPAKLRQHYMIVHCKKRLATLSAFVRAKSLPASAPCKMIVFASSIAEVTFLHYMLGRAALPVGWKREEGDKDVEYDSDDMDERHQEDSTALINMPVYRLHGEMLQTDRTKTFFSFTGSRRGVLICTDVAARGLDFPKIDWIVQYDPPRDVEEYVHRVGRTARMTTEGDALLFLMPHEEPYLDVLGEHNVKLKTMSESEVRCVVAGGGKVASQQADEEFMSVQRGLEDVVATSIEAADLARNAYVSFIRAYSTYGKTTKRIFNPKQLHLGHVASSFALREQPQKIKESQRRVSERDEDHRKRFHKGDNNKRKRDSDRDDGKLTPGKRLKMLSSRSGKIKGFDADAKMGLSAV